MDNILAPENVAMATALVLFIHGTLHALAPGPTANKYKVPNNDDGLYNMSIRSTGCNLLCTSVIVGCLLMEHGPTRYQTYAAASLIWYVEHVSRVLNNEGSSLGGSDAPNALMVGIDAWLVYSLGVEKGSHWAPLAIKVLMSLIFVFGLGFTFCTKFFLVKVWLTDEARLNDSKHGPFLYFTCRTFGITMTQTAILIAALEVGDLDIITAFGISCGVLALGTVGLPLVSAPEVADGIIFKRRLAMAIPCAIASYIMLKGGDVDDVVQVVDEVPQ